MTTYTHKATVDDSIAATHSLKTSGVSFNFLSIKCQKCIDI